MIDLITLNTNLQSAMNTLAEFRDRLPGAEAAKSAADEHLQSLIAQSVRGASISEKTMRNARIDAATAYDTIEIIRAQIAEAEAGFKRAQAEYDGAQKAINEENLARRKREAIAASDEMAKAGAAYGAARAKRRLAYEAIFDAYRDVGRAPPEHERDAFKNLHLTDACGVPGDIQQLIISRASVVALDMGRHERGLWLNGAAPDSEADEPFDRAAREERERIGRQQANEASAAEDAKRRAYVCEPDWLPTEMQNAMARGSVQVGEYRYVVRKMAMGR